MRMYRKFVTMPIYFVTSAMISDNLPLKTHTSVDKTRINQSYGEMGAIHADNVVTK